MRREKEIENNFVAKTFTWMFIGLLITGAVSTYITMNPAIFQIFLRETEEGIKCSGITGLLLLFELIIVFVLILCLKKLDSFTATCIFLLYAGLNGITLTPILFMYTAETVGVAFFVTAGTFGAMCLYGFKTKRDLTSMGSLCIMALVGLIIAMIVNIIVQSSMMGYIISGVAVIVFTLLTAFDAQKIKEVENNFVHRHLVLHDDSICA